MKEDYFDEAISFGSLYKGMKKSCIGVRWKDSVAGYECNGLKNTLNLMNDLKSDKYKIKPYEEFHIYEPKERTIVATRLRDRQFQRSLCESGLYEDICEHFIRDNVACQQGKGTDDALKRMKIHMGKFYRKHGSNGYVLKCDVHHFFAETSHEVAKKAVDKYVSDKRAAEATKLIIDSFEGEKGIGLGSQVSQLVELLVLNDLDHYIKERLHIKYYVRYMDDFILIDPSKEHLQHCRKEIEKYLANIGLSLNKKTFIFPIKQGVWFLKWKFIYTDTGKILMLIDKKKIYRQRKRLKKLLCKELRGEVPKGTADNSLECWLANVKRGNTWRIQEEMVNWYEQQQLRCNN